MTSANIIPIAAAIIAAAGAVTAALVTIVASRRARRFRFTTEYWNDILDWH